MTMPSERWSLAVGVVGEDGVREGGGGGVAEVVVDEGFDVVGGEDLEGGGEGGLGEGVGVFGEEEGAGGVLGGAVFDDGLGDGGDVVVVEGWRRRRCRDGRRFRRLRAGRGWRGRGGGSSRR